MTGSTLWGLVAARSEGITTVVEHSNNLRRRAHAAHAQGLLDEAIGLYQEALAIPAASQELVSDAINLGALLRQQGHLEAAARHYRKWLPQLPQTATLTLNACNCLRELGQAAEALAVVERCMQVHPSENSLVIGRAECLLDLGQLATSRALLEGLLGRSPDTRQAWVILGVVLTKQEQLEVALNAFAQADALCTDNGQMAANQINILKDLGRTEEAEQLWRELPDDKQHNHAVRGALAGLRLAQNKPEEASVLLATLCAEQAHEASHWLNWAACLRSLKYTVAPAKVLKRALTHHPEHWDLQEALGQALAEMGAIKSTQRIWQLQKTRKPESWKDIHLFNRQFLGISSELVTTEQRAYQAKEWERRRLQTGVGPLWPDYLLEPLKGRTLRVGYLTADACNHPVGRFLLPILKNHDGERVETWVLSCGHHQDWISDQLRQASQHWLDLRGVNDQQAARLVADLRLDVLVELGGFTGGSRVGILVHRPAPVQLSYLGYPAPTYLNCIDGWIGDEILFSGLNQTDQEAHRLLNIKGGYMAFDAGGGIGLPSRDGTETFRFGCFNHARKLSDATIELFVEVMQAVPQAELVLKSISFHEDSERDRIRKRFEQAGLEPMRLVLLEWVKGGLNHLMCYGKIDVALDPVPYGGATTTCEALWMGVPVITLAGAGMIGRLSASVLKASGCSQWIAESKEEYLEIAESIAKKGRRQLRERLALRQLLEASYLCDGRRLSRELEDCFTSERARVVGN